MVCAPVRSIIPSLSSGIISPYRRTNCALSLTYLVFINIIIIILFHFLFFFFFLNYYSNSLVPNHKEHCQKTFILPPVTYFGRSKEKPRLNLSASKVTKIHIQLWLRLTGELSFLIGEKIDRGLASLRSPIRF